MTENEAVERLAMEMLHALTGSDVYREQFALLPDDDTPWTLTKTHMRRMARAILREHPAVDALRECEHRIRLDHEKHAERDAIIAELGVGEWEAFMPMEWHHARTVLENLPKEK